ncbi:MAG: tetratricopeptide repeat protein [Muribaculaceae bacterium]|nr:tetratricopeptide repeat protein [Muribaculaceae bacterium]
MLQLAGGVENNRKILDTYTSIADRDTTNIEWLLKAGVFIDNYIADYSVALSYYQKALSSALEQYGEKNPDMALSYNNIGTVYDSQGDYDKALEYFQKAPNIWLEVGEEHPYVMGVKNAIEFIKK